MYRLGIDIGSTTIKGIALDDSGKQVFGRYARHGAKIREAVTDFLQTAARELGDAEVRIRITGSIGMGVAERCSLPFVQEVVAMTKAVRQDYPQTASIIDIGGEDAKIVLLHGDGESADLRMNGNCAGGTGAFIDQMAILLGVEIEELNELASHAHQVYPIASRCGVFCKTDIQNLIAKNVSREDIAASIFHAVAVQTIVALAHGCDIGTPILLCGGPLTFIPMLRQAFADYLSLQAGTDILLPADGRLLTARGAALSCTMADECHTLSEIQQTIDSGLSARGNGASSGLSPIFATQEEYASWQARMARFHIGTRSLDDCAGQQLNAYLGIDSGSTTTKIVLLDDDRRLLYSWYGPNGGNPVQAVERGLQQLHDHCTRQHIGLHIAGSCSTGYGEDLVKAAFQLQGGIIETIAHYLAAARLDNDVSFILDIGGQDMKAIFVNQGVIDRIEINEACSSGCGSFMETFAESLGYTASQFAALACTAKAPCDLGTRCTVFMNSKVKQALREGASVADVSAGLAYSVVKNCIYKVLKLKDTAQLGKHIVVQGGTMRNDAIVRALEMLTGAEVSRCDRPELMGAYGCALYAQEHADGQPLQLEQIMAQSAYTTTPLHCKGCDNRCLVMRYRFGNGKNYYAGNRCERVFTNGGENRVKGENAYRQKEQLLFDRPSATAEHPLLTIGIPRCLNMYEDYPFWHALFTGCGLRVVLSADSDFRLYEHSARMVMSDNICFPAKLVHEHIEALVREGVDRIFMPFVVYEQGEGGQNSYNCPIVAGYSEVIKSVQAGTIPIDTPVVSFKDRKLLFRQCLAILTAWGVEERQVKKAFEEAERQQANYTADVAACCEDILRRGQAEHRLTILLAGRPYHTDMLVQHNISEIIAGMGANVITDDLVRGMDIAVDDVHFVAQWAYPNRILKAAKWCTQQAPDVQMVQMTSFGCGPDAFLTDEVRDLLMRRSKTLTLLKLDDINNAGSLKLRVRSMIESLKLANAHQQEEKAQAKPFVTVPVYDERYRQRTMLIPFFTPYLSPLLPAIMRLNGYRVENLPLSDELSGDYGLRYANNEVCYPATLIVGDVLKALRSGKYDPSNVVVGMTQTGGQCRATNYVPLIKKALVDAGYTDVPVVAVSFGESLGNYQPGFRMNWFKLLPITFYAILYSDCIAKFYHASVVRERKSGTAAALRDKYLRLASDEAIPARNTRRMNELLAQAAREFNDICTDRPTQKVGVVGEIFLKFNPFAQKHVTDWLIAQGIEVVPPVLLDFFAQAFVNRRVNTDTYVSKRAVTDVAFDLAYRLVRKHIEKVNRTCSAFRYFTPFNDIFEEAKEGAQAVSLSAQFGEGWLLPAEIISMWHRGVNNVVSLQPFGCIANHIVSKGIEKKLKHLCPGINLLSIDFDSGVSEVNIINRLLLFIDNLKADEPPTEAATSA